MTFRIPTWRTMAGLMALVALATLIGCTASQTVPTTSNGPPTAPGVKIGHQELEELGVKVRAFADAYASRLRQACDDLKQRTGDPKVRKWAHREKLDTASTLYMIATDANPAVAMLDMVALVQLKRLDIEERITSETLGEEANDVLAVHQKSEKEVWDLAGEFLSPQQQDELRELIQTSWKDQPGRRYAGLVRFTDLAAYREKTGGPSSLFGLLGLDPMAGLDPVAREAYSSRLLAERAFFMVKRAPILLSWQAEDLLTEQSESITNLIAEKVAAERENIMSDLEDQERELRDLLKEARETLAAADDFAWSLNKTTQSVDLLVSRFMGNDKESDSPGGTPAASPPTVNTNESEPSVDTPASKASKSGNEAISFEITEYTEAITQLSQASRDLNELVMSLDLLLRSPTLNQQESPLGPTINEAETSAGRLLDGAEGSAGRLLDSAYKYLLTLLLVILVGTPAVMILYRLISRRLIVSRQPATRG